MEIFSIFFLFIFLPVTLALYWIVPPRFKHTTLALVSLLALMSHGEYQAMVLISALVIDYFCAPYLVKLKNSMLCRGLLIVLIVKNLYIAYIMFDYRNSTQYLTYFVPFIFLFTAINYLNDVYMKNIEPRENFLELFLYAAFFSKQQIGPVVDTRFITAIESGTVSWEGMSRGFTLIAHGFAKKVLIADRLLILIFDISKILESNVTYLAVLLYISVSILYVYFALSGYSDVAKGVGLLFGLSLPSSFKYPFTSISVSDFFRKFNITVFKSLRQTVYIFMPRNTKNRLVSWLSIIFTLVLVGIWYGSGLTFVAWGAFLGVVVILEDIFEEPVIKYIPKYIRIIFTLAIIVLSFAFFTAPSIYTALDYFKILIGAQQGALYDNDIIYTVVSNAVLIAVAVIFTSGIFSYIGKFINSKRLILLDFVSTVFNLIILGASVIFLIAG